MPNRPEFFAARLLPTLALCLGLALAPAFAQMPQSAQTASYQGGIQQQQASGYQAIPQPARENVLIILDASYSMTSKLGDGNVKMVAAKRAIMQVLQNLPDNVNAGLRVYGQSNNGFTACRATELLVPFGPNNRTLIASKLIGIQPTGATPISHTLITAINQDFRNLPGKKSIILVSDGMETCSADPCEVAVDMVRHGIDVKINVVGFGLTEFDAEKQLKCVALSTKGKFSSVRTEAELANTLHDLFGTKANVSGRIFLPAPTSPSPPPAATPTVETPKAPQAPPLQEKMLDATASPSQKR